MSPIRFALMLFVALALCCARAAPAQQPAALPGDLVLAVATGESDERAAAIAKLVTAGNAAVQGFFQALIDGDVQVAGGKRVLIIKDGAGTDAATGEKIATLPDGLDEVIVNNRMRGELEAAMDAFKLSSPDRATRLAAIKTLESDASENMLPLIDKALAAEQDAEIKARLLLAQATLKLKSADAAVRLAGVKALATSNNPGTKMVLLGLLEKSGADFAEPDAEVRAEAQRSLTSLQGRLSTGERVSQVFSGFSLGSILLLAALGLAITYGLMGVINMAHGEMIMIGAYSTYLVQNVFRSYLPGAFDWYLLAALPVSFGVAALVGMVLERGVIRFLYGRPLETLLATWGISLVLIQSCRTIFGAQNVQVENPVWMSGGIELLTNVVLPWNRIIIIGFAFFVLLLMWLLLSKTRLGLFVRAVTQNRAMASCVGVPTRRVDTWCFGLGSGIAGLAGCALSQIGNVGPDLGQTYIVDSFMVVVLGGVGQLAGTVYAAMGLGILNKFLEGWAGAVLAKIAILVFIIIFIQKRPQGLFAVKGRFADA
jgi:urea transport system permease protein